jgi:hypothetical protein
MKFHRSLLFLAILLVALSVLLVAPIAMAADANPAGDSLALFLGNVVFPVLAAFLLGLIGVILDKLRKKYNLDISAAVQSSMEQTAKRAIGYVEERAAAAIKNKVTTLTGNEKLDMAVAYVLEAMPRVTPEQAERLVHGVLGETVGAGATGAGSVKW